MMKTLILACSIAMIPETPWDLIKTVKEDNWIASSRLKDDYHIPDKGEKEWKGETVGFIAEVGSTGTDAVGRPTLFLRTRELTDNDSYTCVLDRKEKKEVHHGEWVLIRGVVGRKLLIYSTRIIFVGDSIEAVKKQFQKELKDHKDK